MGFWGVVDDVVANADILVIVGDARMPEISINSELERKAKKHGKEVVIVFTKKDLATSERLEKAKKNFPEAFFVSGTQNEGVSELRMHLQITAKKMKIDEPRIGVVGYPNIGKSALLNALARRARALVADKPGTTRGVQWIKAGNLRILDTPGVIPYDDRSTKLVLLGSKHPDGISEPEKIAYEIVTMAKQSPGALKECYGIESTLLKDEQTLVEEIGKKRGFLKKGGIVDEKKTCIQIIRDWQKGKLKI
ncbi:GTPase RsgA [Candidatus Pacearchaeota archaeon]|nr:GTPase RsgA [Candidatus Pacearchaeota archaeon]